MEIIKLGDRISIPSKNVKGEIAYIGNPHFADGSWFGIILDDPIGKHNGTIDNKRYFKSARNHGMFIKASYFERECVDIITAVDKRCSLTTKRLKYPNYQRVGLKPKMETTLAASNCITNRKMKALALNENVTVLGDNVTNTNEENEELMKITESGDDFDEKKIQIVRRYPNYLKASSKVTGNHFCLNKNKGNKTDHDTENIIRNNDKNLMLPTTDSNDNPDKDENEASKRIVYPNYLKASSKLTRKHCVSKRSDVNDDEINESSRNTVETQTSKGCADNNDASENPNTHLIKYPCHTKISSNFKENYSCSPRKHEMEKPKSMSKNEDCEISKNDHIKDTRDKSAELKAVKHENEDLKCKLKSTEASAEEAVNKYNDAQEEIKHLKYDNECQRKQIKFQKNHLKLLKMSQGNAFHQTDSNKKTSKQKKIDEILEIALNKLDDSTNTSEAKCDLENLSGANPMQRVFELEEQNSLMLRVLVELRNFLKEQCESQSIELEPSNSRGRSQNRSNKKRPFSESFDLHITNSEASTTDESAAQSREYSEMLREMTKFNEFIKEKKRENVKDWQAEDDNLLAYTDLNDTIYPFVQTEKNSSCGSPFDINDEYYGDALQAEMDSEAVQNPSNLKKNDIHKNCQTAIDQNSKHFPRLTKMKGKINKHHVGDGVSLESVDCINKMRLEMSTKNRIYDESSSLSNTILIEQNAFDNEVPEYGENCSSEISEAVQEISVDIPCHSTSSTVRSNGDSPMVLPKTKRSNRKVPELRQRREMWNR